MNLLADYLDCFQEIWQIQDLWNNYTEQECDPSWISCIDESMIQWLNKLCPGWMCAPRKPHPFGNEYHLIVDIDNGALVMWRMDLREGKEQPSKMGVKEHNKKGKMIGQMVWLVFWCHF